MSRRTRKSTIDASVTGEAGAGPATWYARGYHHRPSPDRAISQECAVTIQAFTSLVDDPRPAPSTAFERVLHAFLDAVFEAYPTWATGVGYHLVDDRWPDASEAGRQGRVEML